MAGDPNWLYSSVVQSSAAIVAIIGGLVTSSVLNLTADRRTLERRLKEHQGALDLVLGELAKVSKSHHELCARFSLETYLTELIKLDPVPSLKDRPPDITLPEDFPQEIIEETWEYYRGQINRAHHLLRMFIQRFKPEAPELEPWLKANENDAILNEREIAQSVFDHVVYGGKLSKDRPTTRRLRKVILESEDEKLNLEAKRQGLEQAIVAVERQLQNTYEAPPQLWFGLLALGYLAMVGIIVPLVLMPQDSEDFRDIHKYLVISLFASGLVLVFAYLFALIIPGSRWAGWLARARGEKELSCSP
jgi:hypothetical protein